MALGLSLAAVGATSANAQETFLAGSFDSESLLWTPGVYPSPAKVEFRAAVNNRTGFDQTMSTDGVVYGLGFPTAGVFNAPAFTTATYRNYEVNGTLDRPSYLELQAFLHWVIDDYGPYQVASTYVGWECDI